MEPSYSCWSETSSNLPPASASAFLHSYDASVLQSGMPLPSSQQFPFFGRGGSSSRISSCYQDPSPSSWSVALPLMYFAAGALTTYLVHRVQQQHHGPGYFWNDDDLRNKSNKNLPSNDHHQNQDDEVDNDEVEDEVIISKSRSTRSKRLLHSLSSHLSVVKDDISQRIGELPSSFWEKRPTGHWPWDRMRRKGSNDDDDVEGLAQPSSPDENNNLERTTATTADATGDNDSRHDEDDSSQDKLPATATEEQNDNEKSELCIGSIFGLDVGGTLAKLAYFESLDTEYSNLVDYDEDTYRVRLYRERASAQAVCMARRGNVVTSLESSNHASNNDNNSGGGLARRSIIATTSIGHVKRFSFHEDAEALKQPSSLRQQSRNKKNLKPRSHSWNSTSSEVLSDDELLPPSDNDEDDNDNRNMDDDDADAAVPPMNGIHPLHHSSASNQDLLNLSRLRQESVPDDLHAFAEASSSPSRSTLFGGPKNHHLPSTPPSPSGKVKTTTTSTTVETDDSELMYEDYDHHVAGDDENDDGDDHHDDTDHHFLKERATSFPKMESSVEEPSSGMKRRSRSLLYLPSAAQNHEQALHNFYTFAQRLDSYQNAVKDHKLSFYSHELGGKFHFIRFETRRMQNAMDLIRANKLHNHIHEMGGTGGGAHKFAQQWQDELGITMRKQDELDSLVAGMQFVLTTVIGECYTFRPRAEKDRPPSPASQQNGHRGPAQDPSTSADADTPNDNPMLDISESNHSENEEDDLTDRGQGDEWWWSRKVQRDSISYSSTYPYLVVTIGTGVSILRVDGPRKYERVSGSTIGGGTYLGLIRLLTDMDDFEDVMRLAQRGDPTKVDMLVGDIYGKNSDALEKLGLAASLVASSFGKLVAKEDPAAGLKQEDLARALLLMITINIGQVAYLNAQLMNTPRIYFVGNFLRNNKISQRRLSFAINYWSKGEMEALFLEHEGYFGALGAFLLAQKISVSEKGVPRQWKPTGKSPKDANGESKPMPKRSVSTIGSTSSLQDADGKAEPLRRRSLTLAT